jgi:MFS family permease
VGAYGERAFLATIAPYFDETYVKEDADARGLAGTTTLALLLASAQAPLGSTMIAVGLPSISHDLHRELSLATSLLVTSYLIVNIIGQSPGGKLGDVFGHATTVRFGMLLQGCGAVVGLVAHGLGLLVVSRSLMALGGAFVIPATMALLRVHVPPERRGRVFGLVGATMGLSAAIGPPLGGELVSRFGWRSLFFAPLPGIVVAVLLLRVAGIPSRDVRRIPAREFVSTFDFAGTALFAAGLAALVIGSKMTGALRLGVLAGAVVTLAVFLAWEVRARNPVFEPRLFRRRAFAAGSGIVGLQNFAMYGLLFQLPQYFEAFAGAAPKAIGRVLFAMMVAMFVSSAVGGRAADRFGARRTGFVGAFVVFCGMAWMLSLRSFATPRDAIPALVVLGAGLGLSNAPSQASAMGAVSAAESGMAAGATSTLRYVGGVASILVLGAILGAHGATIEAHEAAIRIGLLASGLAVLLTFLLPPATLPPRV